MNQESHAKWIPQLVFWAFFLVVFWFEILSNQGLVEAKLHDWKLLPQKETFTELHLNDHINLAKRLPTEIRAGEKVSFSFTIHNYEGRVMTYPYEVYVSTAFGVATTGAKMIDSGSVMADEDSAVVIAESYIFKNPYEKATFLVVLSDQGQVLHFTVPNRH